MRDYKKESPKKEKKLSEEIKDLIYSPKVIVVGDIDTISNTTTAQYIKYHLHLFLTPEKVKKIHLDEEIGKD